MRLKGADMVMECLLEQGVDTVFGYPGGAILEIYDSLYKYKDKIQSILTSHEQGASHAADGYAKSTGKVGVCMATSGPGATNLVTGIATAFMDSVPIVAITANVGLSFLGKDSFQEIDITGITMPITKHNFIVKKIEDLAPSIRKAFKIAREGRPGPVLIDITKDVTAGYGEYEREEIDTDSNKVSNFYKEENYNESFEKAVELIEESKKPFVFVGGGIKSSNASDELKKFVELIDAPVTDSLMGKGAFDGKSSRYTGMLGMHGTKASNLGVAECDLLVAIGTRFSDRVIGNSDGFASKAKIIHIDIDDAEINKNVLVDLGIAGDAKYVLENLNLMLKKQDHTEWMKEIENLKDKYPIKYNKNVLTGPYVIEKIKECFDDNTIICTEVGQNQMWAAQYFHYNSPRQFVSSGGLGTMGYGLGAAIGVKYGNPKSRVINIAGDGCFRMNMNELATASRYNVPIIQVILNNKVLGMVRQWQTFFYEGRYSDTVLDDQVDFCKVAEGLGCKAVRVTKMDELEKALLEADSYNGPFVIECMIQEDDKVFPMVAPGKSLRDTFDQDDL
ncbi:biosynthetic-type acetolactate synthase large subunit [Peptacetobacter hiranonis]|uniref:Acetolactate synthase n=1 Tax=Peptacetobacter hiranonis (strain DSM 13275 / JCM 10541 / KCTC 15199 / TO-931) TaxID=500633 RepID=B6G114_PEPHT|nr:biosynthetic-type acetolactate synthase large subunit [Peptacetobacter hiranonis]EEA84589.1 acetolactate synthase, large subunit, biosynthetic type [Peptacetobacter hiranonis DSM 13275]